MIAPGSIAYFVDSNVLSEPTKPRPSRAVVAWLREHEAEFATNTIVLGELLSGINILPASGRRKVLFDWFADVANSVPVFVIDTATAYVWASVNTQLRRKGRSMPAKDSLIAATALQHDLTIATRNTADFRHTGVKTVNPFGE